MAQQKNSDPAEVREIITELGLTPNHAAKALDVSVQSIHRWMKDGAPPHQMVKLQRLWESEHPTTRKDQPAATSSNTQEEPEGSACVIRIDLRLDLLNLDVRIIKQVQALLRMVEKIAEGDLE